ncbi:hemolysin family protein [Thermaurantiacus sp.]
MADPSGPSPRPGLWHALRALLSSRAEPSSLRESLEEAIEEHVEEAADDLDAQERTMLRNMLAASERRVADIATPRSDIEALSVETSFAEAVVRFRETGHTRMPLYRGSLDAVVGMLHMKDLFLVLAEGREPPPIASLMREVLFVPPGKPVLDLLADMRRARTHMAIVVDEFGGTDGLATIEDIVEEIVGEIADEHDDAEVELLNPIPGGYEADARLPLEVLDHRLGADFAGKGMGEEVDTLGGLVVLLAGRVPMPGERLVHPNGWSFEVAAGDERRIARLRLIAPAEPAVPEG